MKYFYLLNILEIFYILLITKLNITSHITRIRKSFYDSVSNRENPMETILKEDSSLLRNILMTSCDIATITKTWEVQRKVLIKTIIIIYLLIKMNLI